MPTENSTTLNKDAQSDAKLSRGSDKELNKAIDTETVKSFNLNIINYKQAVYKNINLEHKVDTGSDSNLMPVSNIQSIFLKNINGRSSQL